MGGLGLAFQVKLQMMIGLRHHLGAAIRLITLMMEGKIWEL